jgi:hypothetical protein
MFYKSFYRRTCWHAYKSSKTMHSTSFQQLGKGGACVDVATLLIMFELSSKEHCITNSRKVVLLDKDFIIMKFSYVE